MTWVHDRQLDMPLLNSQNFTVPKMAAGRLTGWDIIRFIWDSDVDPKRYTIVVEALDTAGATFRSIGKLAAVLELPLVRFSPYGKIGAIPDSEELPAYHGLLVRGATYNLASTRGQNGIFRMRAHGKH